VWDNMVFQDNHSAILLEKNGRASSGCHTWHIDIWYYFITDQIKNGEMRVAYYPTDDVKAVYSRN